MSSELDKNYKTMHIDFAAYSASAWYLSGWIVSNISVPSMSVCSDDNKQYELYYEYFERKDVALELNLSGADNAYGFVLVIESTEINFKKLNFTLEGQAVPAHFLEPVLIDSPEVIFASIEGDKDVFFTKLKAKLINIDSSIFSTKSNEVLPSVLNHYIDLCTITDSNLFYLSGWALSENVLNDVALEDCEGNIYQVTECYRYLRSDINNKFNLADDYKAGLVCACRLPNNFKPQKLIINIAGHQPIISDVELNSIHLSKTVLLKQYLDLVNVHAAGFFDGGQPAVLKHLADIWQAEAIMDKLTPNVRQFGELNKAPNVSIIIPIFGRYDFVQHQLLAFSNDSDMQNHEIIYVLDDPRIEREFNIACHGVFNTFSYPFKTIYAGKNLGFAGANNLGASIAKGKYILALNSDVMPSNQGWLSRLVNKFESLDSPGILGTKLVYEDETIQHIGMVFQDDAYYPGIWMNYHPHKGMPSHLLNKKDTELTELVTGACMLMEKEFFIDVEGFDTRYILGDFEDSDLCLKAYERNKKIYIDTQESLYHLERLSQNLVDSGDWKYKLTLLNGLYQKTKWDDAIKKVKQQNV